MHYFLIAGEASGDLHASHLISALKASDPDAVITFFGGDKMAAAAGTAPIVHYRDMAYMGFSEVLRNLDKISANLRRAKDAVRMAKPDALILVDYPSFNLKVASAAAKDKIPVYYYISPKIWAWKKWRIRDIRRLVRRVFAILPFEPQFYRDNGFDATYVGNPSVAEIDAMLAAAPSREDFLRKYRLRDRPLVALMPGSRKGEIRNNLAVMNLALSQFPQYHGVIIAAPGIDDELYKAFGAGNIPVIRPDNAAEVLAHCRAAMVTSGTATLETALCGVPQVVCYRANGAKISYDIMRRLLSVDYVSLPNLIAGREIIPEQLVHLCTPDLVAEKLGPLLRLDSEARLAQLEGYREMRERLGTADAAKATADAIVRDLALK
ncbi:MAG: lipid-A-disaccharide synthase [Muribaculaceae bacterium]|nr:lipid-A-disaccharide synthase [Muribaculaceae bacterium]